MTPTHLALIKANIVSVYQAGAFFGSLSAYVSAHYLGRKRSLWVFVGVFMVGAGVMLAARNGNLGPIYAGRVLAGWGIGGCSMVVPIYISEIAPPAVRGRLVGIYELGWQIGGLVGFWINYGISETLAPSREQWMIPFAVQLIPGGILLIGSVWLKESPRWLISKGRREEALRNLTWIRNLPADDLYIVEEVAFIDTALEEQAASIGLGFWKPFKAVKQSRKVQWRFFLGGMLFLWQNGSGINAINYYSPTVFKSIGITGTNTAFFTTGLFGVVKTALTVVWLLFLIDKLGRRNLLMIGAAGGSVCMWIIGGYLLGTDGKRDPNGGLGAGGTAAVFFFYLWTAFYTPSWNGTPWVINSEMFDQNTRSLGQASVSHVPSFDHTKIRLTTNTGCGEQLVLEFHHFSLHPSDVLEHGPLGMRSLLLLRQHDDALHRLRLVPDPRDQVDTSGKHGPLIRDFAQAQGQQDRNGRSQITRGGVQARCRRRRAQRSKREGRTPREHRGCIVVLFDELLL